MGAAECCYGAQLYDPVEASEVKNQGIPGIAATYLADGAWGAFEAFSGTVVLRLVNRGSKSEHEAAFLDTGEQSLRLKRVSAPPFHDPVFARLAGQRIRCEGQLANGVLSVSNWVRVPAE